MIIRAYVFGFLCLAAGASWADAPKPETTPAVKQNAAEATTSNRWPGVISTGVRSSDLDRSLRFYTQGLGMVVRRTFNKGDRTEVLLGFPNNKDQPAIALMYSKGTSEAVEHGNTMMKIILGVPDVEAVAAKIAAAGFTGGDLRQHSTAKILIIHDPDGYKYEIVETGSVVEPK